LQGPPGPPGLNGIGRRGKSGPTGPAGIYGVASAVRGSPDLPEPCYHHGSPDLPEPHYDHGSPDPAEPPYDYSSPARSRQGSQRLRRGIPERVIGSRQTSIYGFGFQEITMRFV
jgi:hypothetical protein